MSDDEAALVKRCLAGDEAGLRAFVERFQGAVFGLCYRLLGHRQDAEDVVQETFLRAVRNLHRWDSQRPLRPWLLTIAANRCRTLLEKRRRLPRTTGSGTTPDRREWPDTREELAEELQKALNTLREEYRTCFVLFYLNGLSCAEVAQTMGCPEGTVKTWLHRARAELAEYLERRGIVPEIKHELRHLPS